MGGKPYASPARDSRAAIPAIRQYGGSTGQVQIATQLQFAEIWTCPQFPNFPVAASSTRRPVAESGEPVPLDIPRIHEPLARYFRRRRFARFARAFRLGPATRLVDVGGYAGYWSFFPALPRVTIVNLEPPAAKTGAGIGWVVADARRLPFRDGAFDVAFSNSVVEHIPGEDNRLAYAREIARVARAYYVQTPYRWFPVEPHLMTPLIHYLPKRWQRPLLLRWTVWGRLHHPTPEGCDAFLRDISLLTTREMRTLFPGAAIWKERFLGLLKSISAVRRSHSGGEESLGRARAD